MEVGDHRHAPAAFTSGKDPVPIVQEAGWAPGPVWISAENLAPSGIRSPDLPARRYTGWDIPASKPNVAAGKTISIATGWWLGNWGSEGFRGEFLRTHADRPRGPPSLLYNGYWVSFPGVKRQGRHVYRVRLVAPLLLCVSAWNVMGQPLPFVKRNGTESMECYVCV